MTKKKKYKPHQVEETSLWLEHGLHVPSRTIRLCSGIDDEAAEKFISNLLVLEHTAHEPVTVWMDTGGGNEGAGLVIFDAIKRFPAPVSIRVVGAAWSMGAIILQAAADRILTPNASLMIHTGSRSYEGAAENVRQEIRRDKIIDDVVDEVLLKKIQQKQPEMTLGALRDLMAVDTYYFADEAIDMGLADRMEDQ